MSAPPSRTITDAQLARLGAALTTLGKRDMRIGQAIVNAVPAPRDPFFVENDELIARLEDLASSFDVHKHRMRMRAMYIVVEAAALRCDAQGAETHADDLRAVLDWFWYEQLTHDDRHVLTDRVLDTSTGHAFMHALDAATTRDKAPKARTDNPDE